MYKSHPSSNLSATEGQDLKAIIIKKLEEDKTNDQSDVFWEDIMKKKKLLNVGDPILPRRRKLSKKFDEPESYDFPLLNLKILFQKYLF